MNSNQVAHWWQLLSLYMQLCLPSAMNMQISPLSLVSEVPVLTLFAVAGSSELFGWQYHSLSPSAEDKDNFKLYIKEKNISCHKSNKADCWILCL